jgi:hypothetical protein
LIEEEKMTPPRFKAEVSVNDQTGNVVAVYLRVREGEVARTKEVEDGVAYADYDASGELLGVELLGPCDVVVLDSIAEGQPEAVKRFIKGSAPRALVSA